MRQLFWTFGVLAFLNLIIGCETAPTPSYRTANPSSSMHSASLYRRYDKILGKRTFELTGVELLTSTGEGTHTTIKMAYHYPENGVPLDAGGIAMSFQDVGTGLADMHDLTLLLDGQRQTIKTEVLGISQYRTTILAMIPNELFQRITDAKSVDGRIGYVDFSLSNRQLALLRTFITTAKQMRPLKSTEPYTVETLSY